MCAMRSFTEPVQDFSVAASAVIERVPSFQEVFLKAVDKTGVLLLSLVLMHTVIENFD